jgi:uncharacterized protein DUF547
MGQLRGPADARRHVLFLLLVLLVATPRPSTSSGQAPERKSFDAILDTYVRDGFVYYRALKSDRGRLDGYVNSLAEVGVDKLSRDAQIAFWINAYNALVLRTVIDRYPIVARTKEYPARSIRQIPGAFERLTHRVGRSTLTLDQIEQNILSGFHDPRAYLALGRGAAGGGRLRSEAYAPELLETQLKEVAAECANRAECVQVDRQNNKLLASPIFSWREKDFTEAYADKAPSIFTNRTPIEKAIIGLVEPKLLTIEKEYLEKNANVFQLAYQPFDWTLNDLTGRGGR